MTPSEREEGGDGCGCGWATAVLVLLALGGMLHLASGAPQLQGYRALPELGGPELARAEDGAEILVSARLAGDHPVVQPARELVSLQRHGHRPYSGTLSTGQLDREDREASDTPTLRGDVGGVAFELPAPYTILSSEQTFETHPEGDSRWYESGAACGTMTRSGSAGS